MVATLPASLTVGYTSDALSSTPSSISSSKHPVKRRKLRATNTWKLRRKPTNKEPLVNSIGRRYWYCDRCVFWRDVVTTNIRSHLLNSYGITIKEKDSSLKQATKNRLKGLFQKQGELQVQKLESQKETILREYVNQSVIQEALAQLIVVRNLPYKAVFWLEFYALLLSVNYTCKEALISFSNTVPKLIKDSFLLNKAFLK